MVLLFSFQLLLKRVRVEGTAMDAKAHPVTTATLLRRAIAVPVGFSKARSMNGFMLGFSPINTLRDETDLGLATE